MFKTFHAITSNTSANNTVSISSSSTSDIELVIGDLTKKISDITTQVNTISSSINTNSSQINVITIDQIPQILSKIVNIQNTIQTLQNALLDLTTEDDLLAVSIKKCEGNINTLMNNINDVNTTIKTINGKIDAQNTQIQNIQSQNQTNILNISKNIDLITSSAKKTQDDLTALHGDYNIKINTFNNQISTLNDEMNKITMSFQGKVDALNNQISKRYNDAIDQVNKTTNLLENSIKEIQIDLDEISKSFIKISLDMKSIIQNTQDNSALMDNNTQSKLNDIQLKFCEINDALIGVTNLSTVMQLVNRIWFSVPENTMDIIKDTNLNVYTLNFGGFYFSLNDNSKWYSIFSKNKLYLNLISMNLQLSTDNTIGIYVNRRFLTKSIKDNVIYNLSNAELDITTDLLNNNKVVLRSDLINTPVITIINSQIYNKYVSTIFISKGVKSEDQMRIAICPNGKLIFFKNDKNNIDPDNQISIFQDISTFYPINSTVISYKLKKGINTQFQMKSSNITKLIKNESNTYKISSDITGENSSCSIQFTKNNVLFNNVTFVDGDYEISLNYQELCLMTITIKNLVTNDITKIKCSN